MNKKIYILYVNCNKQATNLSSCEHFNKMERFIDGKSKRKSNTTTRIKSRKLWKSKQGEKLPREINFNMDKNTFGDTANVIPISRL